METNEWMHHSPFLRSMELVYLSHAVEDSRSCRATHELFEVKEPNEALLTQLLSRRRNWPE